MNFVVKHLCLSNMVGVMPWLSWGQKSPLKPLKLWGGSQRPYLSSSLGRFKKNGELSINHPPPKRKHGYPKLWFHNYLLSNMAILGIYVNFPGGIYFPQDP